jgi:hypothetical protein
MEDYQLKILTKQSFDYLTDEEKIQLAEWCSNDDEFQGLKSLFAIVETSRSTFQENAKTKSQLDELFVSKYKSANGVNWLSFLFPSGVIFFRQPAFQMAFGILLIFGVSFFFVRQSPVQVAKNEVPKTKVNKAKPVPELKRLNEQDLEKSTNEEESISELKQENSLLPPVEFQESTAMIEEPSFKGDVYASGTSVIDVSSAEEDKDVSIILVQSVSAKPSVLDLLYTTY